MYTHVFTCIPEYNSWIQHNTQILDTNDNDHPNYISVVATLFFCMCFIIFITVGMTKIFRKYKKDFTSSMLNVSHSSCEAHVPYASQTTMNLPVQCEPYSSSSSMCPPPPSFESMCPPPPSYESIFPSQVNDWTFLNSQIKFEYLLSFLISIVTKKIFKNILREFGYNVFKKNFSLQLLNIFNSKFYSIYILLAEMWTSS